MAAKKLIKMLPIPGRGITNVIRAVWPIFRLLSHIPCCPLISFFTFKMQVLHCCVTCKGVFQPQPPIVGNVLWCGLRLPTPWIHQWTVRTRVMATLLLTKKLAGVGLLLFFYEQLVRRFSMAYYLSPSRTYAKNTKDINLYCCFKNATMKLFFSPSTSLKRSLQGTS